MKQFLKDSATVIDRFGSEFKFYVMEKQTDYRTVMGCMLTLLILPVILPFAVYKFDIMLKYDDTNIIVHEHEHYFD